MPTDVRLDEVHHSIRDNRAAQAADKAERIRRRPEIAKSGTPASQRGAVRRWSARNRESGRARYRRYRERNVAAELARVSEWRDQHRNYLAAYIRIRRKLAKDNPELTPMELRKRSRVEALKEVAWTGEMVG